MPPAELPPLLEQLSGENEHPQLEEMRQKLIFAIKKWLWTSTQECYPQYLNSCCATNPVLLMVWRYFSCCCKLLPRKNRSGVWFILRMKVKNYIFQDRKRKSKQILLIEDRITSNPIQLFSVAHRSMTNFYPVCPGCQSQSPLSEGNKKQKNEHQCIYDDLLPNFVFNFLSTRRQCIVEK